MKLQKLLLGAIGAAVLFSTVSANACFIPVCNPNPSNCGHKPPVSDCGGQPPKCGDKDHDKDDKGKCGIVIVIIKVLFGGCHG